MPLGITSMRLDAELHYPEVGVQPWRYRRQALHVKHPGGLGVYGREGGAGRVRSVCGLWPLMR